MAKRAKDARLNRLAHSGCGKRRQEKEQDQHPATHLHHGQDPQRLLQQAERQVKTAPQQLQPSPRPCTVKAGGQAAGLGVFFLDRCKWMLL